MCVNVFELVFVFEYLCVSVNECMGAFFSLSEFD